MTPEGAPWSHCTLAPQKQVPDKIIDLNSPIQPETGEDVSKHSQNTLSGVRLKYVVFLVSGNVL